MAQVRSGPIKIKVRGWAGYRHRSREEWRRAAYGDGPPPIGTEQARWLGQVLSAAARSGGLTAWELEFIGDLDTRFSRWGERLILSDRQMAQLKRIAQKLGVR